MLPSTHPIGTDERTRTFLLPTKILNIYGNVENPQLLLEKSSLQIHVTETKTTVLSNCDTKEKAGILLDFGKEIHGGVRILCEATPNVQYPTVRLSFGESASEAITPLGVKNAGNDHSARDFVIPIPAMSDQEWGQTGFRFLYIELQQPNAQIRLTGVLAVSIERNLPEIGRFNCNDEKINDIFNTAAYTCKLCMQHHLWEGIKRDRLIWVGDFHPEMLTVRSLYGYQKIVEDSFDDITYAPNNGWINILPSYSLWWLCIMKDWYYYTGNKNYPSKNKECIKTVSLKIANLVDENGFLNLGKDYFLDWPSNGLEDAVTGVQALAILALKSAKELLSLWPEETECINTVSSALKRMENQKPKDCNYKPSVSMMYLAGMFSKEKTAQKLTVNGDKDFSTFMSFYILTALAKTAGTTNALNMLRTYYGGMLEMGATTFWEDFHTEWMENACPIDRLPKEGEKDIHGDFGNFCYKNFRHSLCHGWSSGPVPFLMETVLGISFETPGGSLIKLNPSLGDLEWAEGSYPLPQGVLNVRCEKTENGVKVTYSAPNGVTVKVSN